MPCGRANPATITFAHASVTAIGLAISAALFAYGLWSSRHLPFVPDIGDLLAHRERRQLHALHVRTSSISPGRQLRRSASAHRNTGRLALSPCGPATIAWLLRQQAPPLRLHRRPSASPPLFFLDRGPHCARSLRAHALFGGPRQKSIQGARSHRRQHRPALNQVILYGDQAYGSSIPFYLNRPLSQPALLVDGRSSSMLFGSYLPRRSQGYLSHRSPTSSPDGAKASARLLFVPLEKRNDADRLLHGTRTFLLEETSGKALFTDRPLDREP